MFKQSLLRPLVGGVLSLLLIGPGQAELDPFEVGLRAFRQGGYAEAVRAFEQARRAGRISANLDYNLGVAYYRLGQYTKAEQAFRRLLSHRDLAGLAAYNLGLIANKQGDEAQSIQWMREALRRSRDAKLDALIHKALRALGAPIPSRARHLAQIGASLAYDGNLIDPADTAANTQDAYREFILVYGYEAPDGMRINTLVLQQDYSSVTAYDLDYFGLEVTWPFSWGAWQAKAGPSINSSRLGGLGYERKLGGDLTLTQPLGQGGQIRVRYRLSDVASSDRPALEGTQQQLGVDYQGLWEGRLYYEMELNNRTDSPTASYSPTRHSVGYQRRFPIADDWSGRGGLKYRRSDYADQPGGVREDTLVALDLEARRRLFDDLFLVLDYSGIDNRSNVLSNDYSRSQLRVGVEWSY